jgi:hypothetical protein
MITDLKQDVYEPCVEIRKNAIVQHPEKLTRQAAETWPVFGKNGRAIFHGSPRGELAPEQTDAGQCTSW